MANPLPSWYKGQKRTCWRCGKTVYEDEAVVIDGHYLHQKCVHEDE